MQLQKNSRTEVLRIGTGFIRVEALSLVRVREDEYLCTVFGVVVDDRNGEERKIKTFRGGFSKSSMGLQLLDDREWTSHPPLHMSWIAVSQTSDRSSRARARKTAHLMIAHEGMFRLLTATPTNNPDTRENEKDNWCFQLSAPILSGTGSPVRLFPFANCVEEKVSVATPPLWFLVSRSVEERTWLGEMVRKSGALLQPVNPFYRGPGHSHNNASAILPEEDGREGREAGDGEEISALQSLFDIHGRQEDRLKSPSSPGLCFWIIDSKGQTFSLRLCLPRPSVDIVEYDPDHRILALASRAGDTIHVFHLPSFSTIIHESGNRIPLQSIREFKLPSGGHRGSQLQPLRITLGVSSDYESHDDGDDDGRDDGLLTVSVLWVATDGFGSKQEFSRQKPPNADSAPLPISTVWHSTAPEAEFPLGIAAFELDREASNQSNRGAVPPADEGQALLDSERKDDGYSVPEKESDAATDMVLSIRPGSNWNIVTSAFHSLLQDQVDAVDHDPIPSIPSSSSLTSSVEDASDEEREASILETLQNMPGITVGRKFLIAEEASESPRRSPHPDQELKIPSQPSPSSAPGQCSAEASALSPTIAANMLEALLCMQTDLRKISDRLGRMEERLTNLERKIDHR